MNVEIVFCTEWFDFGNIFTKENDNNFMNLNIAKMLFVTATNGALSWK